ncbi:hypothetical protein PS870_01699 [Pseudomonas fluorescens]|uniref:Uncharacterized protein n=1 Tax=Pseudomonas fluorescens TaxID=294 RepID=A0A5E7J7E8_PSEFL|nr:hypothetical protein [Pseudomonas fluorescens]VVO79183.1 hypothetical protein PS870_01699 [Pseudomonas fluorescens]
MNKVNYAIEWADRAEADARKAVGPNAAITDGDYREAIYRVYPGFLLFCFCEKYRDEFATYWQKMEGITPARLHLIEKHHWLPEQALALKEEQILLLLHQELRELHLPAQVQERLLKDFAYLKIQDLPLNQYEKPAKEHAL